MLMANSAITSAAPSDFTEHGQTSADDVGLGFSPRPRSAARSSHDRKESPAAGPYGEQLTGNGQDNTNSFVADANGNPIASPRRVGSPGSDPTSTKTVLSVAGVIEGTNREDVEKECLDYQLKGRSRVTRGHSADFGTSYWAVAGSPLAMDSDKDAGRLSISKSRNSTSFQSPGSPSRNSHLSEMLPLSEFLSQAPVDSSKGTHVNTGGFNTKMDAPTSPHYHLYNPPTGSPPSSIPMPTMFSPTLQSGRVPITTASGEFSGFQQYTPLSKDLKFGGHSRMSTHDHPAAISSSHSYETHPSSTESGMAANGQDHEEDDYLHQGKSVRNYKIFPGRNIFLCGGRIMTSRDFPAFLMAIMLILVPTGLFHGFTSPYLWHRLSPAVPIVQAYLFIVALSSMLKTSWTDPGVLPRGIDGDPPVDPPMGLDTTTASFYPPRGLPRLKEIQVGMYTVRLKYCDTCKIYRPPRCSHCRQCDNCVDASQSSDDISFQNAALAKAPASALVMIYALIMGLAVGALATYHFWLATKNRTTHEQLSASLMRPHVVENPFDRGSIFGNCAAVLCRPPTRSYIRRRDYTVA
ncbi:Palmitoyltransferase zdhhc14 [Mortierella claussenii]|nr:Palmitoyltransferase zdhhc14 [Mortierella claussenii]